MVERVQIGEATLYLGDCAEILPTLGPIDAMVADPPYVFEASGAGIFRSNRACMDAIQEGGLDKGFDLSILSADQFNSIVIFCHNDQLADLIPKLSAEFGRYCLCAWHKDNPMPVANKHYQPDTEYWIHAWKPQSFPIGSLPEKRRFFFAPVGKSEFDHPTVKPLPLMEKVVGNVNAETICDPFMGTGTTGVAAIRRGRKFVGIERERRHFETACQRIEAATRQPDMFVAAPKPVQTALQLGGDAA